MMLCGGQGRSLKSNRCVDCTGGLTTFGRPPIVDSSPGEKLIIVDEITFIPHISDAIILSKFA